MSIKTKGGLVSFLETSKKGSTRQRQRPKPTKGKVVGGTSIVNVKEHINIKEDFVYDSLEDDARTIRVGRLLAANVYKNLYYTRFRTAYLAATFFYTLVANTPMDEPYIKRYKKKVKRKVLESKEVREAYLFDTEDIHKVSSSKERAREDMTKAIDDDLPKIYREKTYEVNVVEKHKPDDDYIRGDWMLYYRGVWVKAFETRETKRKCEHCFTEELFKDKGDAAAIEIIAKKLLELTKGSKSPLVFYVENNNPKFSLLEYGGYKSEDSSFSIGSKYGYKHGVTGGYSYQAPRGFLRLVENTYNAILASVDNKITKLVNSNFKNLDVSTDDEDVLMNLLLQSEDSVVNENRLITGLSKLY